MRQPARHLLPWLLALAVAVLLAAVAAFATIGGAHDAPRQSEGITPQSSDPTLCVAPTDGWRPCGRR